MDETGLVCCGAGLGAGICYTTSTRCSSGYRLRIFWQGTAVTMMGLLPAPGEVPSVPCSQGLRRIDREAVMLRIHTDFFPKCHSPVARRHCYDVVGYSRGTSLPEPSLSLPCATSAPWCIGEQTIASCRSQEGKGNTLLLREG